MKWQKKGRVYVPDGSMWWAKHYAFPPTPHVLDDATLRIYCTFCDENIVGRVGYVDVLREDPRTIVRVSDTPVLDIGDAGTFDENGVLPTRVLEVEDELWMYYVGYQLGHRVKYFQFEGLAVSRDGGETFVRRQRVPVTDRSDSELHHRTSAFVRFSGDHFEMWYVAGDEWIDVGGKPLPRYNLRYARSADGVTWPSSGQVVLDFADDDEHAFGRPWIVDDNGTQRLFYSIRTRSKDYRLGYAESGDGLDWIRKDDEVGIDVSAEGWDSESLAYSSIVQPDKTYLFYNGNQRGRTGFGYAILDERW